MKFPSIVKIPNNKRFNFEPRYYDPIKEEIAERTERIRQELAGKDLGYVPSRIVFERKQRAGLNTSYLQLAIAVAIGVSVVGWIYYGNIVLYALWLFVPYYLFFRFRNRFTKQK